MTLNPRSESPTTAAPATPKKLVVLGSTGSIGTQTLQIIDQFPGAFEVIALTAGKNISLVREQIRKYRPRYVSVLESALVNELRSEFPGTHILSGEAGLEEVAALENIDVFVVGIVGFAALKPTLRAVRSGATIALANKESLVVAGNFLKAEIAKSGACCIPVDSEHNALYQLLAGRARRDIQSLVLTASGGPLLRMPELPLSEVTPEIAVNHPNWKMGPKISVDSATLMNKGLEFIEAHFLFDFPAEQIEIWIHPQSIVHGAIWLVDNTCLTQLSKPDMKSSIGYALGSPERLPSVIPKLSVREFSRLEFYEPDEVRFPALRLAREALAGGASHLIALNAGNEIVVEAFLARQISFPQMSQVLDQLLNAHRGMPINCLEDVCGMDRECRGTTAEILRSYKK